MTTSQNEQSILNSIKITKIIPPILIGLAVVVWLMYRQLDANTFRSIDWSGNTLYWILGAVLMYILRHAFYSWRMRIMSGNFFSWTKCAELIVLWEFSSAVSPTTVGGSGVALFFLSKEKLSTAKTVSIVLYSMVIDTVFFVVSIPLLYLWIGPAIIRPGMKSLTDMDGFGYTFFGVILLMSVYGFVFFYGLFINPNSLKSIFLFFSKLSFLKKYKDGITKTAEDIVTTSIEMRSKSWTFHTGAMLATIGAWVTRFLAVNCIILAFVPSVPVDVYAQVMIMARAETMHVATSFSPTPGGAGVAEYLFGGYYSDYVPERIASLAALSWRLISYYSYLIAGAIIIPVWIRKIMVRGKTEQSMI